MVTSVFTVLGLLILYTNYLNGVGVICPIKHLYGYDCPGCGGTRMVIALLQQNYQQALRYNAYSCITIIPLIVLYLAVSVQWIITNNLPKWLANILLLWLFGFLLFGILRNTEMFSYLKPTDIPTMRY